MVKESRSRLLRDRKRGFSGGFTMIELIFAIVLIGFVMLSIPRMLQANVESLEESLVQEAIFLASTQLSQIMTYHWDENSVRTGQLLATSKILDVPNSGSTSNAFDRIPGEVIRPGGLEEDLHRRFFTNATFSTDIGTAGVVEDIADMNGSSQAVLEFAVTAAGGYKKRYAMDVNIAYVADNTGGVDYSASNVSGYLYPTAGSPTVDTNIKMAEVAIIDQADGSVLARLRAYAANIGEVDYAKRRF